MFVTTLKTYCFRYFCGWVSSNQDLWNLDNAEVIERYNIHYTSETTPEPKTSKTFSASGEKNEIKVEKHKSYFRKSSGVRPFDAGLSLK